MKVLITDYPIHDVMTVGTIPYKLENEFIYIHAYETLSNDERMLAALKGSCVGNIANMGSAWHLWNKHCRKNST